MGTPCEQTVRNNIKHWKEQSVCKSVGLTHLQIKSEPPSRAWRKATKEITAEWLSGQILGNPSLPVFLF